MKKTLVALAVTAFAASASAVTVYDNEGSTVQVDGSLRLLLDNSGSKTKNGNGVETSKARNHSNLKNDGSRFGVRTKHDLGDDVYAFSRLELRFNGETTTTDGFGDLYTHRAYVGVGSKQLGEVSFGRQVTIGDDIGLVGFDQTYGVTNNPLTAAGKAVVRYDYKGIEGLQVGADYRFAEEREKGEVVTGKLKSGYGVGAHYGFQVAEGQSAKVAAGYTRDNFVSDARTKHYKDAALVSGTYTIDALTLGLNYGFSNDKDGSERTTKHHLNTGVKYQVTPAVAVYSNYAYTNGATKVAGQTTGKEKVHGFMLGSSYQVHKHVATFVEGKIVETKAYNAAGVKLSAKRDNAVGVGLRVFW